MLYAFIQNEGIKMICFRSVLVCILAISSFFLCGFKQHLPTKETTVKNQQLEGKKKPLDLTIPIQAMAFEEQPQAASFLENNLHKTVALENGKKFRPVELQANVIVTQEQEAGKTSSADGAGIMIKLNH